MGGFLFGFLELRIIENGRAGDCVLTVVSAFLEEKSNELKRYGFGLKGSVSKRARGDYKEGKGVCFVSCCTNPLHLLNDIAFRYIRCLHVVMHSLFDEKLLHSSFIL